MPESGVAGTGGGGGGGSSVQDGTTYLAGNGGSGTVIIRLSGFVVGSVPVPEPYTNLVYNGSEQQSCETLMTSLYTLNGTWKATNADVYSFTATIPETAAYTWEGGGRGETNITWHIGQLPVDVPTARVDSVYFTFGNTARTDEEAKLAIDGDLWHYDAAKRTCSVTNGLSGAAYKLLPYCTLSGEVETNAGEYAFTATLLREDPDGNFATNFIWRTPPAPGAPMAPYEVEWSIAQAENSVTSLSLEPWQESTPSNAPSSSWQWQKSAERESEPDKIRYFWRSEGAETWTSAGSVGEAFLAPSEYGPYELKAEICADSKHEPGNWTNAEKIIRFYVWRHPSKTLADYVDITLSGSSYDSGGPTDFPVLVRLREPQRDSFGGITEGLPGFRYVDVNESGRELRFLSLDAGGDTTKDRLLPFDVDTWDTSGESLVWVRVPQVSKTAKIRLYWRARDGQTVRADALASDTWANGYVGVWHLNGLAGGKLVNATSLGSVLDAEGSVSTVGSKTGRGVRATSGSVVSPDYQPYMPSATSPFTVSGWYRADDYSSGTVMFAGKKKAYNSGNGWCWTVPSNKGRVQVYVNAGGSLSARDATALPTTWHHLAFKMPKTGSSQTTYDYVDGSQGNSQSSKTVSTNDLPFQLAAQGFAADEIRLSSIARDQSWIKSEYETVNKTNYCTFGLVNQLQGSGELVADEERAWVTYYLKDYGPWAQAKSRLSPADGKYWDEGELTAANLTNNSYLGKLAAGLTAAVYTKMPEQTQVEFPKECGAYEILVSLYRDTLDEGDYTGKILLFDGERQIDIEILKKLDPSPIDPGGTGGFDAVNARILLGNDDLRADARETVTNQSFFLWESTGIEPPALTPNLLPGTDHKLMSSAHETLWQVKNGYLGNIMTNDDALAAALPNKWHTLPWAATSKNSLHEEEYTNAFKRSEVGTVVLRNLGGALDDQEGAAIVSPVYTNGIGTVYFDAVNAYDDTSTNYILIVETTTNIVSAADYGTEIWQQVKKLRTLRYSGSTLVSAVTNDHAGLVASGTASVVSDFYRVIAPINIRVPVRFRIRRYGQDLIHADNDDPRAFIVVDNVVASWPTVDVQLKSRGWYDEKRTGKQILGWETAFSVPFPTAAETNLHASAWLEEGLDPACVSSARFHYRWRYLDAMFEPEKQLVSGELADVFSVIYLDPANGYRTISPLALNGLPGDIEYYYDLTANVPFYGLVDYSGTGAGTGGYTEEPAKGVTSRYDEGLFLPSCGQDYFVRLREGASDVETVTVSVRGENFDAQNVSMELVGDHIWRGFVKTLTVPESNLVEYCVWTYTPDDPGTKSLDVRRWKGNADLLTAKSVPGKVGLVSSNTEWSKAYVDAATGYLMFSLNDETMSLEIARADVQTFDNWSSSRRYDSDLKYYTSANETNSVSDAKTRYPEIGSPSPLFGFEVTQAVRPEWIEEFKVSGGQSAAGYELNKPFTSAQTPNGYWTAAQGMWVSQAYGLTNLSNFALQLEGRGKGTLEFVNSDATPAPNGVETVSFTSRLAQFIDFDSISYNFATVSRSNYVFFTQAAFDEDKAFGGFSGPGSVSLVCGYRPNKGCYEFRITMVNADPELNDGVGQCRYEFYRWKKVGTKMTSQRLSSTDGSDAHFPSEWKWTESTKRSMAYLMPLGVAESSQGAKVYSGLFLSYRTQGDRVVLTGGVTDRRGSDTKRVLGENEEYSGREFHCVSYTDTSADRISEGTYGVLANDCPAVFYHPRTYAKPVDSSFSKPTVSSVTFTNETVKAAVSERTAIADEWWVTRPGRLAAMDGNIGLRADPDASQLLTVYARPVGSSGVWTNAILTVTNKSYAATDFSRTLRTSDRYDIRFAVGGESDDPRVDVVVDSVAMSQWCGEDGSTTNAASSYGYYKDFYYTGAWIRETVTTSDWKWVETQWVPVVDTNRFCRLAPCRAKSASRPLSLRSPYLKGLGSLSFSYRNADPNAKLLLQKRKCGYDGGQGHLVDPPDSEDWTTVATYTFENASSGDDITYHCGDRYKDGKGGYFRLVMPRDVVSNAIETVKTSAADTWGEIEITDISCYDEPAYDVRSWWGWNFLTTGWSNNVASAKANLYDGVAGGVGALNNTLAESTLVDPDPVKYERNDPFVQTPTFTNGYIGAISFRARVYDPDQLEVSPVRPSCVTVWGTTDGALQDPKNWTAVTNILIDTRVYRTYTVKCGDDQAFAALRLGLSGVDGITDPMTPAAAAAVPSPTQRVLLDDFVVSERSKPEMRFRLNYVRPFRLGLANLTAVPDIASRDQQPLLNEEFGIQAELDVSSTSSEIDYTRTPEVTLSYYPSDTPWGYVNWKTNAAAVVDVPLAAAVGTNYVYRSTAADSRGFVQPQQKLANQVYGLVQYFLHVTYWDTGGGKHTSAIDAADWEMPSWYYHFDDPNESHGAFSPFTLLDSVSPGRAWINEVNFSNGASETDTKQFVELAVPAGYDMSGWQLYGYDVYGEQRVFGTLGLGLPSEKDTGNKREGFDFLTLKSPNSSVPEADASWENTADELAVNESYGFQLVRPSGVVEQQVVVQGKLGTSVWSRNKRGTNMVVQLHKLVGGDWTFVAADTNAVAKSVGVVQNTGLTMDEWSDDMNMTPAAINEGQTIPSDWFLPPTGTNVWIILTALDRHVGIVDGTNAVDALTVVVPLGKETNICFRVAPWYQLGQLVRNATQDVTSATVRSGRLWTYRAREESSNKMSLDVSSAVDRDVIDRGALDVNSPYKPAIMNWLEGGTTGKGDFEGTTITQAVVRTLSGEQSGNLTLEEMYWLDIDPTSGNWEFWQGFSGLEIGKVRRADDSTHKPWPETVTNNIYAVTMMITNVVSGDVYAPYRLQGLGNEKSDQGYSSWTSETAKINYSLKKPDGAGGLCVTNTFLPMRTFVFGPGSFGGADDAHPFSARIEILDPYSKSSPGFSYGWHDYPGGTFFTRGALDTKSVPQEPSVLQRNDSWDSTWD